MWKLTIPGVLLSMLACSAVEREPATRGAMQPQEADQGAGAPAADSAALAEALERALASGWSELHVLDECRTDAGWTSLEIFGNGVAIWNREAQFTLTPDQVRAHLEVFREVGFASLAERYGGRPEADPQKPGSALEVLCRVRLELDGVAKEVVQVRRGVQSAELRRLAERLQELSREPARGGARAADLDDGLAKVAAGELAAETLELLLHRKPADPGAEGWLLRVEGRSASSREIMPEEGYADPIALELGPGELSELAAFLAELRVGELPINLWAEHYTDFTARVLSRERNVQARQFAGLTPARHGELQTRFDRLFERLYELHRQVVEQGSRVD